MITLWKIENQKRVKSPIFTKISSLFEPLKDEIMKVNLIILAELYIHKLEVNETAFGAMTLAVVLIIIFSGFKLLKEKGE